MHRLVSVLDTNIFISSVFWDGDSYRIVQKALDNEIIVFISKEIINEIKRVLARDFNLTNHEIDNIIDAIALFTHLIETKEKVDIIKEDDEDNCIIECALASDARFIITQDNHLLRLKNFRNIKILNPSEFLESI